MNEYKVIYNKGNGEHHRTVKANTREEAEAKVIRQLKKEGVSHLQYVTGIVKMKYPPHK